MDLAADPARPGRGRDRRCFLRQRGQRWRQLAAKAQDGPAGCAASPERTDLSDRPERVGDWEGETILGKGHQGAAVTLVERYSKYLYAKIVKDKPAALAGSTVTELLAGVAGMVETLRSDNGSEFARHREIAAKLDAKVYSHGRTALVTKA